MQLFQELVDVIDQLLGPDGCAWDRKQTLHSMRNALIEEAYEVVEAIEQQHPEMLTEELGDLLFCAAFLCRLAEKESHGSLDLSLKAIIDKLIRRHPHVFGETTLSDQDAIVEQWENLKREEKQQKGTRIDVPRAMPALARAERLAKQLGTQDIDPITPEELSAQLFHLAQRARASKLDPEQLLSDHVTALVAENQD